MTKTLLLSGILGLSSILAASADGWGTNYQAALVQAKAQNKLVLLDFTGSDWCPGCKILDEQVFATPTFQNYAAKNYVLVTVDFPQGKTLPAAVSSQNEGLAERFRLEATPTLLIVDPSVPNGRAVGQIEGYDPGSGPNTVIAQLKKTSGRS